MIHFEVKSKKLNLGKRKGQTVFYAKRKHYDRVSLKEVENEIVYSTSLTHADVRAAISALSRFVLRALEEGRAVDLGELGSLRVTVPVRMVDKEEDVTLHSLRHPVVRFAPKADMRRSAQRVSIGVHNPKAKDAKPKTPQPGKPGGDSDQPGGGGVGI